MGEGEQEKTQNDCSKNKSKQDMGQLNQLSHTDKPKEDISIIT